MTDSARPPVYHHSRTLQIIPVSAPVWVIYHWVDRDTKATMIDASPVLCWALVEEWQSRDYRESSRISTLARREESYRVIRPVTSADEGVEIEDSENVAMVTTEWPFSDAQRAELIASVESEKAAREAVARR